MRITTPYERLAPWPSRAARWLFNRQHRLPRDSDGIVTAFRDGEVTLRQNRRTEGFTNALAEHGYQGVRKGDLVIHSMDAFAGAVGVSDSDGKASPVVHCYRPSAEIDSRFYAYLLRDAARSEFITSLAKGIRERSTAFDSQAFQSLMLPVPEFEEQRAIADFLDAETARIDALIEKKRRLASLLRARYREEQRTRMMRNLDPITGFGLNTPGWRVAQLGVLVGLQRGHDLPIDRRKSGPVPIISSGGQSGWHSRAAVTGPGVVTGRYGTVGEVFYVEGPYWPLNTTLYVADFRGRNPRWVYHLLSVLPLDSDSAKSAVTGINRNVIGVLRVPVPSLDEQQRLAEELDAEASRVELLTQCLDRQIELLTEHRQALITAAVTGQLDVAGS